MSESTDVTFKPEAPATPVEAESVRTEVSPPAEAPSKPAVAKPAAAKAAVPAGPPRALPSDEDIAAWIHGSDDVPTLGALFEEIDVKRFDALMMQVKKEELVPQHWQVLSSHAVPDDLVFNRLPEVGQLRVRYKNQELSRRRLQHLRFGWMEMGGRRPAIWTVPDLFAAMRRIYEKKHPINWTEFLSAVRDVWRGSDLPFGQDQLEVLWACLVVVRKNTKK
ncbi:MAG TPA: hypothetical protein VNM67_14560 [Thermoanaerobaculia bacterium]|jgi:hypothetical protein|nr:hypothetical protein [Thermoanaerobaculia bacterium]